jgi:tetratricopeptide (TPR) repeat protein
MRKYRLFPIYVSRLAKSLLSESLWATVLFAFWLSLSNCMPAAAGTPETPLMKKYMEIPEESREDTKAIINLMKRDLEAKPADVEAHALLGVARLVELDVEQFSEEFEKAGKYRFYKYQRNPLETYRAFVNRMLNVVRSYNKLREYEDLYPTRSSVQFEMGVLLMPYSKSLAIEALKRAVKYASEFWSAHFKLAEAFEKMMDFKRASLVWEHLTKMTPRDYRPYYMWGLMFLRIGDFEEADRAFKRGLALVKVHPQAEPFRQTIEGMISSIPRLKEERDDLYKKIHAIKLHLDEEPGDVAALLQMADIYQTSLGEIRFAESAIVRAIHVDMTNIEAHVKYYEILETMGNLEKALQELLFVTYYGGEKYKEAYLAELKNLEERVLIKRLLEGTITMREMVDYLSIYYE